jgi:hypothetical protein
LLQLYIKLRFTILHFVLQNHAHGLKDSFVLMRHWSSRGELERDSSHSAVVTERTNKQTNNDARLAFVGPHIIFVLGASENVAASYI